ncbi:2-C-methyl-D-erythritol 4-phosphate cytidylyltransferase [Yinghuangia soli]|uniref:2-C-methyl-D-erythritol 4-phosphate cytidylyltransferase n=1 Tax=Yinghuangia soli TaxID=2908204 RepID=A0AA41PY05_9ACTN|nr:2-C-methyl-D-erythritol 4-phosphate cytidylyltransferase [Yinghuangia soli]MCF2526899.1 2-C-methyl-D-erythritol 4-phosphate cytidylyltransferase [Yinghuangia soli]
MRAAVLVPAAGLGLRLGGGLPKALRELGEVPMLVHALRAVLAAPSVGAAVVAAPPDGVADVRALLARELGADAPVTVVAGGATRQESVSRALDGLAAVDADCPVVLVHDAARPFVPVEVVEAVVAAVEAGAGAVVPALPVVDTVKEVAADGGAELVVRTVDRAALRAVQTPQGFRRAVLAAAHAAAAPGGDTTDDAGMVERMGEPVTVVPGSEEAFKVTRPFDLLLAEALLNRRRALSSGSPGADLV